MGVVTVGNDSQECEGGCGRILPPHLGRGRPRKACEECRPSRSAATILQIAAVRPETSDHALVAAVRAELAAAGREATVGGQLALELAVSIGSPLNTGSSKAALSKELRATLDRALAGAKTAADPIAELAERRARRASGQ